MLTGKTIVVGVSGGIAVYKVCELIRLLKKLNATVHVIMTEAATKFVTPLTFQTLSQQSVIVDMFKEVQIWDIGHIALAKKADLFLIVPATANIIGKIANGIADDMLSTTVMATKASIIIVPAMNTNMYLNPIVQENIKKLTKHGYEIIEPECGPLACGDIGLGKLASLDKILEIVKIKLYNKKLFLGNKILITAGPTRESIDPVRYFSNNSTGKMGYALAKAALAMGAEVTLITGPVNINRPIGLKKYIQVQTADEMLNAVKENYDNKDIIIMSAAVADYRPKMCEKNKIKKTNGDMNISFISNPDILKWIGMHKKDHQFIVGFAAETNDVMDNGIEKLKSKDCDLIIINDITRTDSGFGTDTNKVSVVDRSGEQYNYPVMQKNDLAYSLLELIFKINRKANLL